MAMPKQLGSYDHAFKAMDLALQNPSGVDVRLASPGRATRFRQMCYAGRALVRERFGRSPWDSLVCTIVDKTTVHIEQAESEIVMIALNGIEKPFNSIEQLAMEAEAKRIQEKMTTQYLPDLGSRAAESAAEALERRMAEALRAASGGAPKPDEGVF